MNKCKDCYNIDCIFISETNGCDAVEYCDDFQPMRNSDKIRAMSDEELAKWINHMQADAYNRGMLEDWIVSYPNDYSAWLDWMRQEVQT